MQKYPEIRLKNYQEAENFLRNTNYIHSDHFKEYKDEISKSFSVSFMGNTKMDNVNKNNIIRLKKT